MSEPSGQAPGTAAPPPPEPQQAAPPPQEESQQQTPIRHYLPRAFGFDWGDLFVECTLFHEDTNPYQLNADGRFAKEGVPALEDPWVEFSSLNDLRVKSGWDGPTFEGYIKHLQEIFNRK